MYPLAVGLEEDRVKENVPDSPLCKFPAVTEGYPEHEEGAGAPLGTKQSMTLVHCAPVA